MNHRKHSRRPAPERALPEPGMADLDFSPRKALAAALQGRSQVDGITIDPVGTHIIDDGLRVCRHAHGWGVSTSIVDLPALIPDGSRLEELAAQRVTEGFKKGHGPQRIWPVEFLDKYASLRSGTLRPAITFKIALTEDFKVQRVRIKRTVFCNKGERDQGSFTHYPDLSQEVMADWRALSRGLYQQRCNDLAMRFDRQLEADAPVVNMVPTHKTGDMRDGEFLVHETMRLTNQAATEFLKGHNLIVPFRSQKALVEAVHVSENYDFDAVCNRLCASLIDQMANDSLPYVHLNSPMRSYPDYLALKVLGRKLSGQDEDPALRDEILDLRSAFNNASACHNRSTRPEWKSEWAAKLRGQGGWHPFFAINNSPNRAGMDYARHLKAVCGDHGWDKPDIAERELMMQGAVLYFSGINLQRDNGRDFQGWAISARRGQAFDMAAKRVLQRLDKV